MQDIMRKDFVFYSGETGSRWRVLSRKGEDLIYVKDFCGGCKGWAVAGS